MTLRKLLFWCHLACGVFAGVVIFIMSVTGALLAYEKQLVLWADTRTYAVTRPPVDSPRLPLETVLANAAAAAQTTVTAVTVRADASSPVAVAAAQRTIYVDPYDGRVLGEGSPGVRRFFRAVTDWHRVLAITGERRAIGRAITGACNLAFLFIVSSGLYLWWPRSWTRRGLRNVMLFNPALGGKARDFNWHNTIGFWSAIPLFFIVLGSAVISYPWASDLAYRIAGEDPPARQRPAAAPGAATAARGNDRSGRSGDAGKKASFAGIDALWARAERQVPGWRSITVRMPAAPDAPIVFTIDRGYAGQPQKRGTLTLNRASGDIVSWEPYAALSAGRRLRTWLRFVHTGEFYGLTGQTIAGLASFGGGVLVYTGLALACRRFVAWRARGRGVRREERAA
jgi:uncharacterized iron-regulated membrane protein